MRAFTATTTASSAAASSTSLAASTPSPAWPCDDGCDFSPPLADYAAELHVHLPSFADAAALDAAPLWRRYLDAVYGVQTLRFPLSLRELSFFHLPLLPPSHRPPPGALPLLGLRAGLHTHALEPTDATVDASLRSSYMHRQPRFSGRVPREAYSLYAPELSPKGHNSTVWLYAYADAATEAQAAVQPQRGSRGLTGRAEIFRCVARDRVESLVWMYHAPGSGVFFELGRSLVARNLYALAAALNVSVRSRYCRTGTPGMRPPCANRREHMAHGYRLISASAEAAAARGFDSLQLTHTEEHGIFKFEIVDLRPLRLSRGVARQGGKADGTRPQDACPRPGDAARQRHYWRGWGGRTPCTRCGGGRGGGECISCGAS